MADADRKKAWKLKQRAIRDAMRALNDSWARGEIKNLPRLPVDESTNPAERS